MTKYTFFLLAFAFLSAETGSLSPLKRHDLRIYTLGGSPTALVGHELMSYYNPAAYAFYYKRTMHHRAELYPDFAEARSLSKERKLSLVKPAFQFSMDYFSKDSAQFLQEYGYLTLPQSLNSALSGMGLGDWIVSKSTNGLTFIDAIQDARFLGRTFDASFETGLLSFQTRNWGTSIDDVLDIDLNTLQTSGVGPGLVLPEFSMKNDLIWITGFGFKFRKIPEMAAGFTGKIFNRTIVDARDGTKFIKLYNAYKTKEYNTAKTSIVDAVTANPFRLISGDVDLGVDRSILKMGNGFGVDAGWMYHPADGLYIGAMINNLYTGIKWFGGRYVAFPVAFDIGASWTKNTGFLGMFENPLLTAGVTDIFNVYDDAWFKHINLGLEFGTFFNWMKFRTGIHEGFTSYSIRSEFNVKNLRKTPFVKLFFPRKMFKPVWWPKPWNYEGFLKYYRENPIVWLCAGTMRFLSLFDFSVQAGMYGREVSAGLGGRADYRFMIDFNADLVF